MSASAALLVFASAFVHALWNALLRRDPAPRDAVGPISIVAALVAALAVAWTRAPLRAETLAWALLAGAFEAAYFLALGQAMARAPLGPVYALARGGAVFLVWPLSMALFGESLRGTAALGAAVLLVGLVLASPRAAASEGRERATGMRWAALTGVFIAGYHLAYTASLRRGGDAPTLAALSLLVAGAFHVARVKLTQGRAPSFTPRRALAGALAGAGFVAFLLALAQSGAGLVLTLRNGSVLFAMLFGLALKEHPRPHQWLGATLIATGAALLTLH